MGNKYEYGGFQDASPKSDRLNQLKQYMDFFNKSGSNVNINPESSIYEGRRALDWATSQLGPDQSQYQRAQPNFYGQQEQLPQQQYVQPQYSQQENPYSARAQELNQGNGQGGGMGGDVTNYLRQMMGGQRGFGGNKTLGVRG